MFSFTLAFTLGGKEEALLFDHRLFVVVSPPKCGTHLIGKTLELILGKKCLYELTEFGGTSKALALIEKCENEGKFIVAHNFNKETLEKLTLKGYGVLFFMRDPRDQLISLQNWMREGQWPWILASKIQDRVEQLNELITGVKNGWRCTDHCFIVYADLVKGLHKNHVCKAKFERLVGENGGGEFYWQVLEILKLAKFLEVPMTQDLAEAIALNLFGGTKTFRSGQIGSWKTHFNSYQKHAFKCRYGRLLIELDYEQDHEW